MKKRFRLGSISASLFGISLSLEHIDRQKEKQKILKDLYCIRNKLVKFYYRYLVDSEILSEDELNERIIKEHYNHAVELYKSIGDILFESHYFVLLPLEERNKTVNAFDSIIEMNTYLERDSGNYSLALEDVVEMIEDLTNLFSKLDGFIAKIDKSF